MIINEIKQYYLHNPQYAKQGLPRLHHNLIVCLQLHGNNDRYVGRAPLQPNFQDESALFCALGWYKNVEMIRQFGKARSDVKLGIPDYIAPYSTSVNNSSTQASRTTTTQVPQGHTHRLILLME
jgi:hypothetical protein